MPGLTTPDIFWSSAVYMISVENVRFLTGVQAVLVPTCQIEKSGLQEIRGDCTREEVVAIQSLTCPTVLHPRIAAKHRGCPLRSPVMIERATETPSGVFLDGSARCEDTVGGNPDANALICAGDTGATEHRKGVRAHTTDDVTRCTIGVGGIHVDAVARSRRDILDRQSCHDGTAPGIARMTRGFIKSGCNSLHECYAAHPTTGTDPRPDRPGIDQRFLERRCRRSRSRRIGHW